MSNVSIRDTLGHFATGVTIVTTSTATTSTDSGHVGLTANSFNSVSLDPPMVLWSLNKASNCLDAFSNSGHFAVHVLASDQVELSKRFAQKGGDKFAGLQCVEGVGGSPLLSDCSARFQCKTLYQYEGGDHIIFVGEVLEYDSSDKPPLLFHKGSFHRGEMFQGSETKQTDSISNQIGFTEDFFPYLMARAHFQINEPIVAELEKAGIDEDDCFIMLLLSIGEGRTVENISRCLEHTKHYPNKEKIADMHERELIEIKHCGDVDRIYLSAQGEKLTEELLSASKVVEQNLREYFGSAEVDSLKTMLKKVILRTDPGVPDLWDVGNQT